MINQEEGPHSGWMEGILSLALRRDQQVEEIDALPVLADNGLEVLPGGRGAVHIGLVRVIGAESTICRRGPRVGQQCVGLPAAGGRGCHLQIDACSLHQASSLVMDVLHFGRGRKSLDLPRFQTA